MRKFACLRKVFKIFFTQAAAHTGRKEQNRYYGRMNAKPITLRTKRLILRPWKEEDLKPFAALNADARVMEYFPVPLTREESDGQARRIMQKFQENGWGLWAVEVPGKSEFIGFIGLNQTTFSAHFTPAVEVGYRLAYEFWGQGYATEGALEALRFGFETLELEEIVSFTAATNIRSQQVMQKLGMHRDAKDDFDHPKVAEGSSLRRHVLFRLLRDEWMSRSRK